MDVGTKHHRDKLAELLERDPGRFEPVTALRVAQSVGQENLDIVAPIGVDPSPVAVSGFRRRGTRHSIRSLLANLTGPVGSLPQSYNELIMREERNRARALAAFFDMFNSRLSELFADASEKYRVARWVRWKGAHDRGGFFKTLLSLAGLGTRATSERAQIDPDLVLRFAGYFANRNRHAAGLRAMLREVTGLPLEIEQFHPRWLEIPVGERSCIGQPGGLQLGINTTAGQALRETTGAFRIAVGPVHYGDYMRLSPDGRFIGEIVALTRLYVGPALDFDIKVILKKEDVPFCSLGQPVAPPRLGWNSWARVAPAGQDSADALIHAKDVEKLWRAAHAS